MSARQQTISARAYDRLQREQLRALNLGFGETEALRHACARIGLWPKAYEETVLIVDPTLPSVIYPFEERCSEDDLYDKEVASQ